MEKSKNLASVIVALAILYAGYEISMEAIQGERVELQNVWPTVASVVCAIVVSFLYSSYTTRVGRQINSHSLVAEFLIRHSVDVVVTKESFTGKGPFYVFSNAAMEKLLTQEDTAEKALAHLGVRYI